MSRRKCTTRKGPPVVFAAWLYAVPSELERAEMILANGVPKIVAIPRRWPVRRPRAAGGKR